VLSVPSPAMYFCFIFFILPLTKGIAAGSGCSSRHTPCCGLVSLYSLLLLLFWQERGGDPLLSYQRDIAAGCLSVTHPAVASSLLLPCACFFILSLATEELLLAAPQVNPLAVASCPSTARLHDQGIHRCWWAFEPRPTSWLHALP
jgi:hypothetical protein